MQMFLFCERWRNSKTNQRFLGEVVLFDPIFWNLVYDYHSYYVNYSFNGPNHQWAIHDRSYSLF